MPRACVCIRGGGGRGSLTGRSIDSSMAKGGLSKLRCMIRRWHSSSRIARAIVARRGGGRRRQRARARRVVPRRGRGAQGPAPGLRRQVAPPVPHRRGAHGPPAVLVPRPPRQRRRRGRLHRRRLRAPLDGPVLLTRAGGSRALPRLRMGSSCGQGWLRCARAPAMAAARVYLSYMIVL